MQGKPDAKPGQGPALGYVSIVRRGKGSGYAVSFPDVPDCAAEGPTVDQAMQAARHELERHLLDLKSADRTVPTARSFHQVIMTSDIKGVIAFVMI